MQKKKRTIGAGPTALVVTASLLCWGCEKSAPRQVVELTDKAGHQLRLRAGEVTMSSPRGIMALTAEGVVFRDSKGAELIRLTANEGDGGPRLRLEHSASRTTIDLALDGKEHAQLKLERARDASVLLTLGGKASPKVELKQGGKTRRIEMITKAPISRGDVKQGGDGSSNAGGAPRPHGSLRGGYGGSSKSKP